jgi:hypothetical protein
MVGGTGQADSAALAQAPSKMGVKSGAREMLVIFAGDKVVEYPRVPESRQITLKVLRWDERDKHLVIKEYQIAG